MIVVLVINSTCIDKGNSGNHDIIMLIIYMKKFLHSDWLRAVQFLGHTVPKKEIQCQIKKGNSVQISLDFKFLNFLTTHVYLKHAYVSLTLVFAITTL